MKNLIILSVLLGLAAATFTCGPGPDPAGKSSAALYDYFPSLTAPDTLHIGVDADTSAVQWAGRGIPDSVLQAAVDSAGMTNLVDEPSDPDVLYTAGYRVSLDNRYELCILDAHRVWFKFKGGLLFDKEEGRFVASYPLAQFYGGDGGQLWIESWLLDWNGDGRRDILAHHSEHALQWAGEDVVNRYWHTSKLWLWNGERFVESEEKLDSTLLVERFPILWE